MGSEKCWLSRFSKAWSITCASKEPSGNFVEHRDESSVRPVSVEEGKDEEDSGDYEDEEDAEIVGEEERRIQVEDEAEVIRKIKSPMPPSREAVEEHWMGRHVVYRDWCEVRVQARGKEDPRQRDDKKQWMLLEYSYDFCFPGMR